MPHKEEKKGGADKFKNEPGNQTPNTPNTPNRKENARGQAQGAGRRRERKSER